MSPIKTTFSSAASGPSGISTFWLLVFALIIADDAQRREKERRKKREQTATPLNPRKPAGPRPF